MTAIQLRCAAALAALGPKPPWWRVFKRRAWMRKARPIAMLALTEAMQIAFAEATQTFSDRVWKAQIEEGYYDTALKRFVKDEGEAN